MNVPRRVNLVYLILLVAEVAFSLLTALIIVLNGSMLLIAIVNIMEATFTFNKTWRPSEHRPAAHQNLVVAGWFANVAIAIMALSVIVSAGWVGAIPFGIIAMFLVATDFVSEGWILLSVIRRLMPNTKGLANDIKTRIDDAKTRVNDTTI